MIRFFLYYNLSKSIIGFSERVYGAFKIKRDGSVIIDS
jgi:hypothetical protein